MKLPRNHFYLLYEGLQGKIGLQGSDYKPVDTNQSEQPQKKAESWKFWN